MKSFKPDFITVISILLLLVSVFLSVKHIYLARKNQEESIILSEVNGVQYGLLNADEWRDNLSNIIIKKIEEFELTDENREELRIQVENILYKLLDEVDKILKDDMGKIKKFLMNAFIDLDKLRENVPQLSVQLLNELSKPENKNNIKNFVLGKLDSLVDETFSKDDQRKLKQILDKNNFENKTAAASQLEIKIRENEKELQIYTILLIISLVTVFLLNFLSNKRKTSTGLFLLLFTTLLFLVNGVSVPMIEIEARITRLTFELIGENIVFTDQVLFFQSKSILDVVWILITNGKADMMLVGVLIFAFSVLFPFTKIVCSYITITAPGRSQKNWFLHFFTFKSSKWSMADVFVVAMFMAFIGFNGIIGNQLEHLRNVNKYVEILTTNGTSLQSGFYLFLSFCLAGLFLSIAIQKKTA